VLNELKKADNHAILKAVGSSKINQASHNLSKEFPLNILIAEDNVINQKVVTKILKKLGYQSEIAENGLQALAMTEQKSYDLILMDVQMPELDGLEATRVIRERGGIQPVIIALTANAIKEDKEECLSSGMDDYISKPITIQMLVDIITKWAIYIKKA
jgi:CheY-like chemotaxis protein